MNAYDVFSLVLIVVLGLRGLLNGLVKELLSLAGLVVALFASMLYSDSLIAFLPLKWQDATGINIITPIVLFAGVLLAFRLISKLISSSLRKLSLNTLNRLLGMFFGLTKGALIITGLIYFVITIHNFIETPLNQDIKESISYQYGKVFLKHINELKQHQSFIAAIPGSSFPSRYSSIAPPPVEI